MIRFFASLGLGGWIAYRGMRSNLSVDGAYCAFLMGSPLFYCNAPVGLMLIIFYFSGSSATKYHRKKKVALDASFHTNRTWFQVFCNAVIPLTCSVSIFFDFMPKQAALFAITCLACSCGDTFASELGSVCSAQDPILLTTLQSVPRGTNGAVSIAGTIASGLGGLIIGLTYLAGQWAFRDEIYRLEPVPALAIGTLAGLIGSLIDSLLGATIQLTLYDEVSKQIVSKPSKHSIVVAGRGFLSNEMVNLISAIMTGLLFHITFQNTSLF